MIFEMLDTGKKYAISAKKLAAVLKTDPRTVVRIIEQERRAGKPICATASGETKGYYIAANRDEMRRYCRSLQRRAGEIFKTRRACMATIDKLPEASPLEEAES